MKILIYYFSGTGNTALCTESYSQALIQQNAEVEIHPIEEFRKKELLFSDEYDIIGIGYPTHAFNAPKIIFDFIKRLPDTHNKKTFLFKTAGDFFIQAGATTQLRKNLNEKGYMVFHESLFIMGANILIKYPDNLTKQLYLLANERINLFANEIISGTQRLQKNGIFRRFFTAWFSKMEQFGVKKIGHKFKTTEQCDLCEVCIKKCPTNNISRNDSGIVFDNKCEFCFRCVYACPKNAIKPILSKMMKLKDPYRPRKIINNPEIPANYLNENTRGFYRRYYKYMIHEIGHIIEKT